MAEKCLVFGGALHLTNAHCWLVHEVENEIAGYAYASKHREREAYRFSVEVSAYVAQRFHRRGIASLLYAELLKELKAHGFHMAFAGVTLPNAASVAFHESMGFTPIGIYRETGFKFDKWHDVGWWQRKI